MNARVACNVVDQGANLFQKVGTLNIALKKKLVDGISKYYKVK